METAALTGVLGEGDGCSGGLDDLARRGVVTRCRPVTESRKRSRFVGRVGEWDAGRFRWRNVRGASLLSGYVGVAGRLSVRGRARVDRGGGDRVVAPSRRADRFSGRPRRGSDFCRWNRRFSGLAGWPGGRLGQRTGEFGLPHGPRSRGPLLFEVQRALSSRRGRSPCKYPV